MTAVSEILSREQIAEWKEKYSNPSGFDPHHKMILDLIATLEAAQNELEVQTTLAEQYDSDGERLLSDLAASRKREEELERHRDELVKSRDHWQEEDKRHQRLLGEANKELAELRVK